MSYDISLIDPVSKETLLLDDNHQIKGGTYAVGGTREASLNITYNYGSIFAKVLKKKTYNKNEITGKEAESALKGEIAYEEIVGIRSIYGMSGADSIPVLEKAISQLSDDTDPDYWEPTEGNAKQALCGLLALAKLRPDGIWDGD